MWCATAYGGHASANMYDSGSPMTPTCRWCGSAHAPANMTNDSTAYAMNPSASAWRRYQGARVRDVATVTC